MEAEGLLKYDEDEEVQAEEGGVAQRSNAQEDAQPYLSPVFKVGVLQGITV